MPSLLNPIPNSPFYSPASYNVTTPTGSLILGSGLSVTSDGTLLVASALGGTISSITAGPGLSTNGSTTGGNLTTTGTLSLLPPQGSSLGGVKAGANVTIAADGTISVAPPGIGTITGVFGTSGITGGGTVGTVTLGLQPASTTQFGGVQIGPGITSTGGLISLTPASTTTAGGVRLATNAETVSGTDPTKAVTPAGLAAKVASLTVPGIVQLSDNANLTSSVLAATSTAVKTAFTAAQTAQTTANAALPKAGGVMAGVITFDPSQTFPGVSFPKATINSLGVVQVGPGLSVNSSGVLSTSNVGTVTSIICGPGIGSPASGNIISTTGTIRLLPPSGTNLGGVKKGAGIDIAFDGTISITPGSFLLTNNQYSYNGYIWPVPDSFGFTPGSDGQVLTILDKTSGAIGWTSTGTLSTVVAGTGLTVTSTPTTATVSLANTGTTIPGTYGATGLIPTFTVNAKGQVLDAGLANPYPPFQIATVTAPPNLVLDFDTNNTNFDWTLYQNITMQAPLNAQSGMTGAILIRQLPGSAFVVTWASNWKFANAAPYGGPAMGEVDMVQFTVVDATYIVVTGVTTNIG